MATTTATSLELEVLDVQDGTAPTSSTPICTDTATSLATADHPARVPKRRAWLVVTQLASVVLLNSFSTGLVTVGLPTMAADVALHESLLVWPSAAYYLTSGTCLLLAGCMADVIGSRPVNLVGGFLTATTILCTGVARTGIELIMFRAMQGIASALVIPTGIAIVSTSMENGKHRNLGFAVLGLAMPLGFSIGLVLGGVFIQTTGWRTGYYVGGAATMLLVIVGAWALPKVPRPPAELSTMRRLGTEIDWIGAILSSACLAMISYVLAAASANARSMKSGTSISLLCLGVALIPAFVVWMNRQERLGRPALIPNRLWKNATFSSICVVVVLSNAVINCMELFTSLFFQEVQGHTALATSIRLLPSVIIGAGMNLATGIVIDKVPAVWAVLISSTLCAGSPLLMAVINPNWPYWYDAFFAQLLIPLSVDCLFTVGLLVVSDAFPARTQALAGAVFNTCAQLGGSIGLSIVSVISTSVTQDSRFVNKQSSEALMKGYRAGFWTLFAWMVTACLVGGYGLRKMGKVGMKTE